MCRSLRFPLMEPRADLFVFAVVLNDGGIMIELFFADFLIIAAADLPLLRSKPRALSVVR